MTRDEFMELVYETFADEPDNVLANGIIEAADAYVEHEKAQLTDTISRQQALEAVRDIQTYKLREDGEMLLVDKAEVQTELMMLPSAQPAVLACGNGELVAKPEPQWIPCSERMPDDNIDVLLQFKSNMGVGFYEDGDWAINTGDGIYSMIGDNEEKPIAWMPLPEPYRKGAKE